MKIKLICLTLILLFLTNTGFCQNTEFPNMNRFTIINEDGSKTVCYADNIYYRIVSDKTYTWYASNKIHQTMGGYSGKLLYGQYTTFFPNKNLSERGTYAYGMKDGVWKTWYDNGHLKKESVWFAGIEEGPFIEYDENGSWSKRGHFKNNLLHGIIEENKNNSVFKLYFNEGKSISKEDYLNSNIFRKSKKLIGQKINQWFRKKDKQEAKQQK